MGNSAEIEKLTVPTPEGLMWPVLEALKKLGGSGTNEDLLAEVITLGNIPEAVQSVPSKRASDTKLYHNLRFAQTKLGKWGALENPSRSFWTITEKGRALTQDQVKQVPAQLQKQYKVEKGKGSQLSDEDEDLQSDSETWKDELLGVLTNDETMKPKAFERLAKRILDASGFIQVEVTGRSGDGGIDGVGVFRLKDKLLSFKVCFQCKRYTHSVSSGEIQQFRGAISGRGLDRGLFITTSAFTTNAKKEAARVSPTIDLIDGDVLCDLLKDLKLGVETKEVESVSIDPQWFKTV